MTSSTSNESKMCYLNNLCFLCLTYNKNVLYHIDNYLKVQDKLKYFLPEQILQKIETPRYVCDNCVNKLGGINEFRRKCLDNIVIFNDYIQKLPQESVSHKIENCDQNMKREIFGTESFEPIENEETKEISSSSSNNQQIFMKTENIEDENIEEFSVKKEINEFIIKEEPFLFENIPQENCNEDDQIFEEYNYHCDTSNINNRQENFVEVNNIRREKNSNENIHLLSDECNSNFYTSIENDSKLAKSPTIEEEGEMRSSQIKSDECYTSKILKTRSNVDTEKKSYTCDVCRKQFKRKDNLFRHKRMHTGERPFVCNICGKAFKYKSNLMCHKSLHVDKKPYECNVCKKKFIRKTYLFLHKLHHSGEKPYECDVCKKKFILKTYLNQHKIIHLSEKPHKCNVCEKAFKNKYHLIEHIRIHTNEKSYECEVCQKQFTKKSNLFRHKRIHTDERPYVCNNCGKAFKNRSNLTNHNRLHAEEKSYECDI